MTEVACYLRQLRARSGSCSVSDGCMGLQTSGKEEGVRHPGAEALSQGDSKAEAAGEGKRCHDGTVQHWHC